MCLGYITGGVGQLFVVFSPDDPLAPVWYLSLILFINTIVLYNVMLVRKYLKQEL